MPQRAWRDGAAYNGAAAASSTAFQGDAPCLPAEARWREHTSCSLWPFLQLLSSSGAVAWFHGVSFDTRDTHQHVLCMTRVQGELWRSSSISLRGEKPRARLIYLLCSLLD